MNEIVESEAQEVSAEVVQADPPTTLFRTTDPAEVLTRAQSAADALMPVVREKGMTANIQGKEHLTVEAWQTLGAMLGVTPVTVWTHPLEGGWEARVEARTLDGRVVGAAEAQCMRAEGQWKKADEFAIRSMAQTRATSKALASVLRFVATLAGVHGTPAEDMPRDGERFSDSGGGGSSKPSPKQLDYLDSLLKNGGYDSDARMIIGAYAASVMTGGRNGTVSEAIEAMKSDATARATADGLLEDAKAWQQAAPVAGEPDTSDLEAK